MVQVLVANYYEILDKKLENSTMIVIIIALCIVFTGVFATDSGKYAKANLFEVPQVRNTVMIDGQEYEIILKKL